MATGNSISHRRRLIPRRDESPNQLARLLTKFAERFPNSDSLLMTVCLCPFLGFWRERWDWEELYGDEGPAASVVDGVGVEVGEEEEAESGAASGVLTLRRGL
ncbi:hypothetical protein PS2_001725 [Malus domestica]